MKTNNIQIKKCSALVGQTGQALLFVIVAMTIALTAGVAITSQTLGSLKRTAATDSASRVFLAAEGGIEWFLRQNPSTLANLSDGDTNSGSDCPAGTTNNAGSTGCTITYQPQDNDKIQSKATITVSSFSVNYTTDPNSHYHFVVNPGSVKEVSLTDRATGTSYTGNIDLCFSSLEASQSSAILYYTYNDSGIKEKKLISPNTVVGSMDLSGDSQASTGKLDYDSCTTLAIASGTTGLRIKSLYAPAKIGVFPSGTNFPTQGYKISSLGQIDNVSENVKAVKQITVYRSLPYASSAFDYAIYSNGVID